MPQLQWKPARRRVINYGSKRGGIHGVEFDMTASFFAGLDGTSQSAVIAMAKRMNDAMLHVFITNGFGGWGPNGTLTQEAKGHDRVMAGRSLAMLEAIGSTAEVLILPTGGLGFKLQAVSGFGGMIRPGSMRKTATGFQADYGWPQTPHPDTAGTFDGITGEEKEPRPGRGITIEDIAMLHEAGFTVRLPTMGKPIIKHVPPRAWLTLAADVEGPNITVDALNDLAKSMDAFGVVARATSANTIKVRKVPLPKAPKLADGLQAKSIAGSLKSAGSSGRKKQMFNRRKKK